MIKPTKIVGFYMTLQQVQGHAEFIEA